MNFEWKSRIFDSERGVHAEFAGMDVPEIEHHDGKWSNASIQARTHPIPLYVSVLWTPWLQAVHYFFCRASGSRFKIIPSTVCPGHVSLSRNDESELQ